MLLFQPIKIGNVELKNRIVMTALHLGYCKHGYIDERIISFYKKRAEGETGLIIAGCCNIDGHKAYPDMLDISDDKFIKGHEQLSSAIKKAGSKVCLQLIHAGRYASSRISGQQPIAPSPVPSNITRETPAEMTLEDIDRVIDYFARAAKRAVVAGYDMVELIASAGYLISQFFSPVCNRRTDKYGGNFANRARFGIEAVKKVREAVGDNFPIIVRLSGNEFMPDGNTNLEMQEFAVLLKEAGVDAFNITGGWHESRIPQITMDVPNGAYVYLAQGIKHKVDIPVIACNRINDPLLAEQVLRQESADLVGMARSLIADPEMPKKTRQGRFTEIRKCIGCNQGCLDNIFAGKSCTCTINPIAGSEYKVQINAAPKRKKVLIIGGGPAGMEAARITATRGHDVYLWEKSSVLGGQLLQAAAIPGRGEITHIIEFLKNSINNLNVKVTLNKDVKIEDVKALQPEAIIVATGATPNLPAIKGIENNNVWTFDQVLNGRCKLGKRVIVIGGGATGCEVGLYVSKIGTINSEVLRFLLLNEAERWEYIKSLATKGVKDVTILEQDKAVGRGIGASSRWPILQQLKQSGVKIKTMVTVREIKSDKIVFSTKEGDVQEIPADSIIIATGVKNEKQLFEELNPFFSDIQLIGDARIPGTAWKAIHDGFAAAYEI